MIVRQELLGSMRNFGYLVVDERTRAACVIDPSFDARPLQLLARELDARIGLILNTHGHGDHCRDNERLKRETGARVAAHASAWHPMHELIESDPSPRYPSGAHGLSHGSATPATLGRDVALEDGGTLPLGALVIRVVHTPGHCPDACCFVIGDAIFTGDTLFVGDCGRVDLPESDVDAMFDSLLVKLRALPDELVVYPGHDYGPTPTSTLGWEKAHNPTLLPRSPEQFRQFMSS